MKSFCNQITNCPTTQNATVTYLDSLHSLQNRAQSSQSISWVPGLLQNCRISSQWGRGVGDLDILCIRIQNIELQKPAHSFRGVVLGDLVYSFEHSSRCMQIREPWIGCGKPYWLDLGWVNQWDVSDQKPKVESKVVETLSEQSIIAYEEIYLEEDIYRHLWKPF